MYALIGQKSPYSDKQASKQSMLRMNSQHEDHHSPKRFRRDIFSQASCRSSQFIAADMCTWRNASSGLANSVVHSRAASAIVLLAYQAKAGMCSKSSPNIHFAQSVWQLHQTGQCSSVQCQCSHLSVQFRWLAWAEPKVWRRAKCVSQAETTTLG